ncbi:hypothetical protein DICPUDRAFT_91431 [Dictyostelium purpureum]|uniref:FZ domain-containing protein n=1 Tax=Dictyostelium purpureum TaxID=5786 RepID=F0ZC82_DICPU|nr:uncharacterized protein DICPUDRAFT_91431 [Dictyostelium purpureum]EGC38451.1 hypothetical protein DICPUDRAFT_91431 [Dictyostelium purpureum]|eukprot:XP_003285009.1 hypothetical protein DICPUDRAFT_91431 [Dictyostelium purpureum]
MDITILTPNYKDQNNNNNLYIDELIYYLLYQYQYNLSPKPNLKCAEFLSTYLCTYTFVEVNKKPCNDICEAVINKCSKELIITNFQVIPNQRECESNGTLAEKSVQEGKECSLISLISSKSLESWWTDQSINLNDVDDYIKYPGGVVRGSVLGFGVLLAILLIIGSLHFVMKYQDKIV